MKPIPKIKECKLTQEYRHHSKTYETAN
jgi:hypothetical protein